MLQCPFSINSFNSPSAIKMLKISPLTIFLRLHLPTPAAVPICLSFIFDLDSLYPGSVPPNHNSAMRTCFQAPPLHWECLRLSEAAHSLPNPTRFLHSSSYPASPQPLSLLTYFLFLQHSPSLAPTLSLLAPLLYPYGSLNFCWIFFSCKLKPNWEKGGGSVERERLEKLAGTDDELGGHI